MPFYQIAEMVKDSSRVNPKVQAKQAAGEFMKVGIVTKPEGEGPPLHMHPNEEQWTLILEGNLHYVLGDEEKVVGPGDLIHIPRFTNHRSRSVGGPATFFTVKSPVGDGNVDQDYNLAEGADVAERLYELMKKKEAAAKKTTKKKKATKKKKKAAAKKKKTTKKRKAKKTAKKRTTKKKTARKKPARKTKAKRTAKKATKARKKTARRKATKRRR